LEIPNLSQRSKSYVPYLVKNYCWRVKGVQNPAHSFGERLWFVLYGVASTAYQVFICIRILLFLNDRLPEELFLLVPLFAISAIIVWVFLPICKFLRYLISSGELARTRERAVASTLGALVLVVVCIGILKVPDRCRVEGIVEPVDLTTVHAESDGFVTGFLPSDRMVSPGRDVLVEAVNPALEAEKKSLLADIRGLEVRRRIAQAREIAAAQILTEQIKALNEKIARVDFELSSLQLQPTLAGTWISPNIEKAGGVYLRRGQQIGFVANLDNVLIRATAGQELAAMIVEQAFKDVEIWIKGRPDMQLTGQIEKIFLGLIQV
jgi:putative peptide zinc metalloprotease protein